MNRFFQTLVRLGATGLLVALPMTASAAEAKKQQGQPAMSAEEQAQMDEWVKRSAPGDNHKVLEAMVGTFDAKVTMWMQAGAPPQESGDGVSENRWVLGGRYVEQRYKGTSMGMPFEGIGYTGYDNIQKQYVGTWMDNFGTGIVSAVGVGDATKTEMTFKNEMMDPTTGKPTTMRSVLKVADKNHHVYEMYGNGPDGKEFKMMAIAYSRK